jgi:eukaryotic-like serine/threonine-protein kinase
MRTDGYHTHTMPPRAVVELHAGEPSPGSDGTQGRSFLQDRLRLWTKVGLVISSAFFLAGGLLSPLYGDLTPAWQSPALHLGTLVIMLAGWLELRRAGRSPARLRIVDAGLVTLVCLGFARQVLWSGPALLVRDRMTHLLVLTSLLAGRAIFVPSSAHRSFWLGLAAAAPIVGLSFVLPGGGGGGAEARLAALDPIWVSLWSASAIALSSFASAVIYGLRRDVREAQRLGQYTLGEKLGAGGMGVVYRATHAMLRRPTAVKLLPPESAGELSIRRFEREVQLTASLTHPNTVAIFDYGRTRDGVFYYAMELLDGIDLAALVGADGPQPAARVRHMLRQVLGALQEAHGVGLIHRDIKPANIILCQRGGVRDVVKVVDFGLVKDVEAAPGASLTNVDTIAGTPQYLSPEAITSPRQIDARADIYALGAVGYFLLTGAPVFEGATAVEVCSHHLHTAPPPPSRRLGRPVPPALERLILSCLEKDPSRRPQSARALSQSLDACENVGRWDAEMADAWWDTRGRAIMDSRAHVAPPSAATAATFTRSL